MRVVEVVLLVSVMCVWCVSSYSYAACDDLRSRLSDSTRVLHRGAHKEVKGAVLRPANDSVVLKRTPNQLLGSLLTVYEVLLKRSSFLPTLFGWCSRSSDMLVVQERVLPLAYAVSCLPTFSVSMRLVLLERAAMLMRFLIQTDVIHCDFHRGQIGVRLHGADGLPDVVLLDSDNLQRAGDANRAEGVRHRCSSDQECRKLFPCLSNHRPYNDQRCSESRCSDVVPARWLVAALADLVEPIAFPGEEVLAAAAAATSPSWSFDASTQSALEQLLVDMRRADERRLAIVRVIGVLADLRNRTAPFVASDRDALLKCAALEEEVAIAACRKKKFC
jgi:hypothetical protein